MAKSAAQLAVVLSHTGDLTAMRMAVWIGATDGAVGLGRFWVHLVMPPLGSALTPSLRQKDVHVTLFSKN